MSLHESGQTPRQRIDSWTSIATYLGRSSRTVQRWSAQYHLPVYRLGGKQGPVFAYAGELDRWMWDRGRLASVTGAGGEGQARLQPPNHVQPSSAYDDHHYLTVSQISEKRSAESVALAHRMWDVLSHSNIQTVVRLFRQATDLDPKNAEAFAGLSMALIIEGIFNDISMQTARAGAEVALQRALDINSSVLAARCPRSWLKMIVHKDWQGAREGFEDGLKIRPSNPRATVGRALLYVAAGALGKGSDLMRRAVREYPLNARVCALYCWIEYLSGELGKVLAQIKDGRLSGHSGPVMDAVESFVSIQMEEPHKYVPRIEALAAESPDHDVLQGALGYAYTTCGETEKAQQLLARLTNVDKHGRTADPYAVALILIGLDDKQKAVQRLEASYNEGSLWSFGFPADPMLGPLRNDPYFRLFWSKVDFPGQAP